MATFPRASASHWASSVLRPPSSRPVAAAAATAAQRQVAAFAAPSPLPQGSVSALVVASAATAATRHCAARRRGGGRRGGCVAALREGDLGEAAGEAYFPTGEEETVGATGQAVATEPPMRIGHGYDIHKMLPRDSTEGWGKCAPQPAVIGGVTFEEFPLGVVAHSDGDVIYHSTTDAILGALGLPDIGQLFPDNDPRWRGANSEQFFDEAVRLMELRKYRISNVDVTIIAEKPRLAARKLEMKANLVRICHTVPARVNIKARTHEQLDSVGECRALECHVVILLERCA